jgi:competence protein ComEC
MAFSRGENKGVTSTSACQLSYSIVRVIVLAWGTNRWFAPRPPDRLEQLIDESRPAWVRFLRGLGRAVAISYAVTIVLGLAVLPLVAARYHLVAPVGLLIGPPVVVLCSVALVTGFLLLFAAAVVPWLVPLFAWATQKSLALCTWVVDAADRLPLGHTYVGAVPVWWLLGFYAALLAGLLLPELRRRARWMALAGLGWVAVGLTATLLRPAADELRVAFLAVGHGGCTVIETPDGRTLLYDAGALAGPDVTRRVIAPYLWHRGVRRIDDVLLSHADLDHFNGLPALLDRFRVGRITLKPTFADKSTPGVHEALAAIERAGVGTRVVAAGDVLTAGDVTFEVLRPPPTGPSGPENVRSLVLLVRHAGHTILLTGDLEGAGLERVLALPSPPVDVLTSRVLLHDSSTFATIAAENALCRLTRVSAPPRRGALAAGRGGGASPSGPGVNDWSRASRTWLVVARGHRRRGAIFPHPTSWSSGWFVAPPNLRPRPPGPVVK